MSIDQQPAQTDHDPNSRGSGRGERFAVVVGVVVTVLAVAGIGVIFAGGDDERPAVLPSAAPSIASSVAPPSAVPVVRTPADLAADAAEARYRDFLMVEDAIGQAAWTSSAPYDTVTVAPERQVREAIFRQSRQIAGPGGRRIGNQELASLSVTSVDLTPETGGYPKVVLQACVDVSGVDAVDRSGKSVVSPERVSRAKSSVTMYEYAPGTRGAERGGWYVYEATSKGEPC
jgi:hypothetical protein